MDPTVQAGVSVGVWDLAGKVQFCRTTTTAESSPHWKANPDIYRTEISIIKLSSIYLHLEMTDLYPLMYLIL